MREPPAPEPPARPRHPTHQAAQDAIARALETVAITRELMIDSAELCAEREPFPRRG